VLRAEVLSSLDKNDYSGRGGGCRDLGDVKFDLGSGLDVVGEQQDENTVVLTVRCVLV